MTDRPFKILLVDDDRNLLVATARVLGKAGYEVLEAADGARALELALASRPDLVLADVAMTGMDGVELCRRLKAAPGLEGTLVVLLSGIRTTSDQQSEGLEHGADGYIARPVANRELLARVAAMVRLKRAEDERDRLIAELREALARIKTLSGLIPICSSCKKVRNGAGYWEQVEEFIAQHSQATFSHALCAECLERLYPEQG